MEEEMRGGGGEGEGVMYVKVMTDEQMEVLRKQISVYATICEQLVEMHKAITAQQDSFGGTRLGSLYCDPLMTSGGHKITARQRWTPTPVQLQILEAIFDQGNGTPSKQKIKEITSELAQHGQISETNVYNWFQNRRARSKRKQTTAVPNNSESEVEAEVESPNDKKAKPESLPPSSGDLSFHSTERSSELHPIVSESTRKPGTYTSNGSSNPSGNFGQMSFYKNARANPGLDHLMAKMEFPGGFSTFRSGENYDMVG